MPGLSITIAEVGEQIVRRDLLAFAEAIDPPESALEAAATVLREATERQFETEGSRASGGWKPLTAARVAEKARKGLDPHILRATDRLMLSLIYKFDPEHIERLAGSSLEFGSTVPYLVFHQSTRPRTKMPYRPPIALTQGDRREMAKTMQRAIRERMRARR